MQRWRESYREDNRTWNLSDVLVGEDLTTPIFNGIDWGPRRDPLYVVVPVTVLYVLIFITGVLGNVSTCIVIVKNKSMHTATNYYLFSLAISDLLLLTSGLPPEIYKIWSKYPYVFGEAFCVLQGFAAETSANATVLTITAFTVERYVAICHPFLSQTLSKLSRAIRHIVAIWVMALCLAVPQAMSFGVVCEVIGGEMDRDHCLCIPKRTVLPHAFEISTFVFFVAPMSMITVLYVLIGVQLHKSVSTRSGSIKMNHRVYKPVSTSIAVPDQFNGAAQRIDTGVLKLEHEDGRKNFSRNSQATRHVVKMLVAVVVAFFICWAPFHAQRLLAVYGEQTSQTITAFEVLTYISGVFYYLSTTVNPLLYHIMSHKYKAAFKATYKQCCGGGRINHDCNRRRRCQYPTSPNALGRCYSTLSRRSSRGHSNSHSNTDSCSRSELTTQQRPLETEMASLHHPERPLVVSFRRQNRSWDHQWGTGRDAQQTVIDNIINCEASVSDSFAAVHQLRPVHVCPLMNEAAL